MRLNFYNFTYKLRFTYRICYIKMFPRISLSRYNLTTISFLSKNICLDSRLSMLKNAVIFARTMFFHLPPYKSFQPKKSPYLKIYDFIFYAFVCIFQNIGHFEEFLCKNAYYMQKNRAILGKIVFRPAF